MTRTPTEVVVLDQDGTELSRCPYENWQPPDVGVPPAASKPENAPEAPETFESWLEDVFRAHAEGLNSKGDGKDDDIKPAQAAE